MAEAMKNANLTKEQKEAARQYLPGFGQGKQRPAADVEATGKTGVLLDKKVKLFIITKGRNGKGIWAASDDKKLAETFRTMSDRMNEMTSPAQAHCQPWRAGQGP